MTNINAPVGGQARDVIGASEYTAKTHKYIIPSTDSSILYKGDFVKIVNNSNNDGIPYITKAAAGDVLVGTVISIQDNFTKQEFIYRAANETRAVYVQDDPFVEIEVQANGIILEGDIGKYANIIVSNGDNSVGVSHTQLDISSITTDVAQLKILGIIERQGNGLGQYAKLRCLITKHEFNNSYAKALFNQQQIFYVGKAGTDSADVNFGKSSDRPFLTIPYAILAAIALTPSVVNQVAIEVIDAGMYADDFTLPSWVNLNAPNATLQGNITVSDNSMIICKRSLIPSTGAPPRNFNKSSGTGIATINILDYLDCGAGRGLTCVSGTLIANTPNANHGDGYLMGDGAGTVILNAESITSNGNGYAVIAKDNGNYNLNYNKITSTSASAVFGSGASGGVINASGGYINATSGRLYQFGVASQFTLNSTGYFETNASTNIGGSSINFLINRDKNNNSILSNSLGLINFTSKSKSSLNLDGGYQSFPQSARVSLALSAGISNETGDGTAYTIIYDSINYDRRSNYNIANGKITIAVAGEYKPTGIISLSNMTAAHNRLLLELVTTSFAYTLINCDPSKIITAAGTLSLPFGGYTRIINQAETVSIRLTVFGSTKTIVVAPSFVNLFSLELISYT